MSSKDRPRDNSATASRCRVAGSGTITAYYARADASGPQRNKRPVATTFPLDIVTPEKMILSETVSAVQLPAVSGSMGILAGHAPLLAELGVGECVVKTVSEGEKTLVIAGGFVEVSREKVTVLADTAEFAHEIDMDQAEASLQKARELLANVEAGAGSRDEANETMRRAQARIRVARGGK